MPVSITTEIQNAADRYINSIYSIDNDISFWNPFLMRSVKEYASENEGKMNNLFASVFGVYDESATTVSGFLKTKEKNFAIDIHNMQDRVNSYFNWIMNLSIVKAYSSMEVFLLQIIQLKYFPDLESPVNGATQTNAIHKEVREHLKNNGMPNSQKNNKHIIKFLQQNSVEFNSFSALAVRIDLSTTWEMFFDFISILRNIIAHHNMIVTSAVHKNINSIAKKLFARHFYLVADVLGDDVLCPIGVQDGYPAFKDFLTLTNTFALNTMKFIFNVNDLSFIGLK